MPKVKSLSCGLCVRKCPADIFTKEKGSKTVDVYDSINCLQCEKCMKHCPENAIYNKYKN